MLLFQRGLFVDINSLRQIKKLPNSCVFGLISDSSKECYISHTTNLKARIGQIIDVNEDILKDDSRLVVFSSGFDDMLYKRIYAQYWLDKYINDGYSNVGPVDNYINGRIKVQFSQYIKLVFVMYENKRKDKIILGVFDTVNEANEFVDQYFSGKDLVLPVYAINKRTGEWRSTNKGI